MFDKQVSDAGVNTATSTMNAGRKRLEDNPAINNAIASTGMSAKDYFVASIAVAQAERFMGNPKAAPPTPTLPANAEFLRQHQAELSALRDARAQRRRVHHASVVGTGHGIERTSETVASTDAR